MTFTLDDLASLAIGSARGRKGKQVSMEVVRELQVSDLDLIQNPPPQGVVTSPLAKLRHSHHMLARLLAQGTRPGECSMMTGYSLSRISILQNDPAFRELISYYAANVEAKYLDVHERLASLGLSSLDELQERLDQDPDSFKNKELMDLAELALDRSVTKDARKGGQPGASIPPTINVTFVGSPAPQVTAAPATPLLDGEVVNGEED